LHDSEILSHGRFGTETKNSGFICVCFMKELNFLFGCVGVLENVSKTYHFSEQTKNKDLQVPRYVCTFMHMPTLTPISTPTLQVHPHVHLQPTLIGGFG
jgi:hypothetical protein